MKTTQLYSESEENLSPCDNCETFAKLDADRLCANCVPDSMEFLDLINEE